MTETEQHKISAIVKTKLFELLKQNKIDNEKLCDKVIEIFFSTEKHFTISDIVRELDKTRFKADFVTVEKIVRALCGFGLACERKFEGEDFSRFEHLHFKNHHDHFICVKCNKVIEFQNDKLEDLQSEILKEKGFKPIFHKLEIYGVCDKCLEKTKFTYQEQELLPLTYYGQDTIVKVKKIENCESAKKRLTVLGFVENEPVKIIKNSGFGPLVLEIKNTRLAIGRCEASNIYVIQ